MGTCGHYRRDKYIWANCAQLVNFISLPKLLQLDHYDVKWLDYQEHYKLEGCDLRLFHSPLSYSKNTSMTTLEKMVDASVMTACTHNV